MAHQRARILRAGTAGLPRPPWPFPGAERRVHALAKKVARAASSTCAGSFLCLPPLPPPPTTAHGVGHGTDWHGVHALSSSPCRRPLPAQHMPSHVEFRAGEWHEASEANSRAVALPFSDASYPGHNMDMLM